MKARARLSTYPSIALTNILYSQQSVLRKHILIVVLHAPESRAPGVICAPGAHIKEEKKLLYASILA